MMTHAASAAKRFRCTFRLASVIDLYVAGVKADGACNRERATTKSRK